MAKTSENINENLEETVNDSARPQDGADVNEDGAELVNVNDLITVASIGCKPKPARDETTGRVETITVGSKVLVAFPDQDLFAIGGRMTGYGFVITDNGTSLELHGDFKAQSLTPDHNGEVDIVTRGSRTILVNKAEKLLLSQLASLGYPVSLTDLQALGDNVVNGETGTTRTVVKSLTDAIQFAFIIGARQSTSGVTGYEYTVKAVEKVKKEAAASDMMLAAAMKKRKVMLLAAPGSKHAE